jgi:hypothetical protein
VVAPLSFNLPLLVLCVRNGVQLQRWGWALLGALVIAQTLISGHALLMGIVCMTGGAQLGMVLLHSAARPDWPAFKIGLRNGVCLCGLGVLLGAFVLLPTASNLAGSQRQPFSWDELRSVWLGNWQGERSDKKHFVHLGPRSAWPAAYQNLARTARGSGRAVGIQEIGTRPSVSAAIATDRGRRLVRAGPWGGS